jgi:hypothetical protein
MNHSLFDDLIRQKANSHEAPVPDTAWENIFPEEKKHRRPILWLFMIPLLMAGAGYWMYIGQSTKKQITSSQTKNIQRQQDNKNQSTKESTTDVIANKTNQQKPAADEAASSNAIVSPGNKNSHVTKEQKSIAISSANGGTNPIEKTANKLVAVNDSPGKTAEAIGTYPSSKNATANGQSPDDLQTGDDKGSLEIATINDHQKQVENVAVASASALALSTDRNEFEKADTTATIADSSTQELATTKVVLPKISNPKWRLFAGSAVMAIVPGQTALTSLSRSMEDVNGSHAYYTASSLKFSYQPSVLFGLGIQRNLGKRWAIGTGIQYQQIKEQISLSGVENRVDTLTIARLTTQNGIPVLINESIIDTSSGTRIIEARNSYRYVSVPIYAQYKLLQGRGAYLAIQMSAIVNVSGKYNNSIEGDFEKTFSPAAQNFKHWGFDGQVSLVAAKKLGNRFEVFVAPTWRINKSKPADQNLTNSYLHQLGLGFGLSYGLGH